MRLVRKRFMRLAEPTGKAQKLLDIETGQRSKCVRPSVCLNFFNPVELGFHHGRVLIVKSHILGPTNLPRQASVKRRAGAISAMLVCLKSAEPFYEPSVLTPARSNNRYGFERSASGVGRTLRYAAGSAPAPPPRTQNHVPLTLLNWRKN